MVLCHWLLFCECFFLVLSLSLLWSQSCVVSGSLSLILVWFSVIFPHSFSVTFVVSILCCQWVSVFDFLCCESFFLILSLSPWWSQSFVVSHSLLLILVLSGFFPHSFSVTFVGSILCCQSFSVIDSCSVSHFFSLVFCHLCGLLFCESFFLTLSLSLLWSQSRVVSHSVSLTLVLSVHFSDSFFLSILCCQSVSVIDSCFFVCPFFLILSLSPWWSQSCVVSHSLLLILVLSVHVSHFSLSPLCCQSLSVIDSCFLSVTFPY